MSLNKNLVLAAIAFASFMTSSAAMAADVYSDKYSMYLEGEIRRGDAERVALAFAEARVIIRLVVNSRGGDLNEAMKIVSLVKDLHWAVAVAKGKVCASSCFFIWLAGENRVSGSGVNADGTLKPQGMRDRWQGVLGIHRPYLRNPNGDLESPKKQEDMMLSIKRYLVTEGVSQYLIDEMMSHPSNDIYWLRDRDVEAIGEYPPGIEEMLIAKCGFKRTSKIVDEGWSDEKMDRLNQCINEALGDNIPLYITYSAKLKKGWRPWSK